MGPEANNTSEPDAAKLYLDILRRSPLDASYLHPELIPVAPLGRLQRALVSLLGSRIDDYRAIEACRAAVDDYRRSHAVDEELHTVDWNAVYWRRSA